MDSHASTSRGETDTLEISNWIDPPVDSCMATSAAVAATGRRSMALRISQCHGDERREAISRLARSVRLPSVSGHPLRSLASTSSASKTATAREPTSYAKDSDVE